MAAVTPSVTGRWIRVAQSQPRRREPSEHKYILAMMCVSHAWEHCDDIFPTLAIHNPYEGLCNKSPAKEDVTLGLWT